MTELFEMPFAQRGQNVASVILSTAPDIVCLSERHNEWAGILDNDAMDGAIVLSDMLAGSCSSVAENYMACGDTEVANRVPIFYNPAVFKCVDSGILKLTEEYSYELSENKRVVTWAILEDVTNTASKGQQIAVFNTHWSFYIEHETRSYADIRAKQSREMQELINSEKFANLPHVVCGDFNAEFSASIYQELLQNCQLSDADWTVNGRITWNCVDHIAASGVEFKGYTARSDDVLASDHHPIFADITILN